MEPSVEWHLAQHDMTVQLEGGVREALANRITNHCEKKEKTAKKCNALHLVCSGRVSVGPQRRLGATQSEEEGWC
jgi:hypothetical protein